MRRLKKHDERILDRLHASASERVIFASDPVYAQDFRETLLWACAEFDLAIGALAESAAIAITAYIDSFDEIAA